MGGRAAKSSKHHYYSCNTYLRRGKTACNTKPLSRAKLEPFVIDQLRTQVLTERNLKELVRLTNEEIRLAHENNSEQLHALESDLEDRRRRLIRLYDALETGRLDLEDLAPRIKQLNGEVATLEEKQRALKSSPARVDGVSEALVAALASDLQGLLARGSVAERKSFLRSFIKRIEIRGRDLALDYTFPPTKRKAEPPYQEVLPFVQSGSP
jgi:DNA repair exonuclease SbcCD ATPase subunit